MGRFRDYPNKQITTGKTLKYYVITAQGLEEKTVKRNCFELQTKTVSDLTNEPVKVLTMLAEWAAPFMKTNQQGVFSRLVRFLEKHKKR